VTDERGTVMTCAARPHEAQTAMAFIVDRRWVVVHAGQRESQAGHHQPATRPGCLRHRVAADESRDGVGSAGGASGGGNDATLGDGVCRGAGAGRSSSRTGSRCGGASNAEESRVTGASVCRSSTDRARTISDVRGGRGPCPSSLDTSSSVAEARAWLGEQRDPSTDPLNISQGFRLLRCHSTLPSRFLDQSSICSSAM
jgi:hypothetical protein